MLVFVRGRVRILVISQVYLNSSRRPRIVSIDYQLANITTDETQRSCLQTNIVFKLSTNHGRSFTNQVIIGLIAC